MVIHKARHDGLEPIILLRLVNWIVLGVLVGGFLGDVLIYHREDIFRISVFEYDAARGFNIYSFGGFVTCGLIGYLYFYIINKRRKRKTRNGLPQLNIWAYSDAILYGFTLGWFFGRVGCFMVHDHPGTQTEFWLGVYGICPDAPMNVACHDLGLYEAIWAFLLFGILTALNKKPRFPGFFVGTVMLTYGVTRFGIEFLRHPATDIFYFGWPPAQYASLLLVVFGSWILWTRRNIPPVRLSSGAATG